MAKFYTTSPFDEHTAHFQCALICSVLGYYFLLRGAKLYARQKKKL